MATRACSLGCVLVLGCSAGSPSSGPEAGRDAPPVFGSDAGARAEAGADGPATPVFISRALSSDFVAEGADVGDLDGDGSLDVVAGPVWFAGPGFDERHDLDDAPVASIHAYARFFFTFVDDVDGDGRLDVVTVGLPGAGAWWYENPGAGHVDGHWPSHPIRDDVGNESPAYVDLLGNGHRQLVFMRAGALGFAAPGADPRAPWTFTAIGGSYPTPFVHGLGVGDVDGDGLADVVEATGWWRRRPVSPAAWGREPFDFALGGRGGAQMLIQDVDGDGRSDVVTSLDAHGYGLTWFRQTREAAGISFEPHEVLAATASPDNISQLHALVSYDVDGDGRLDVITGKRFYAHEHDPGAEDPIVLAWFGVERARDGVAWRKHVIHVGGGVGVGFAVRDVDGDGRPDVVTSSKTGTWLHLQR